MIENRKSTYKGGITIEYRYDNDPYAETDYLGSFRDSWQPGVIDTVSKGLGAAPYRDTVIHNRYFVPAATQQEIESTRLYYRDHGYSKHEADTMSRGIPFQQYDRWRGLWLGAWDHVTLIASVYYRGKKLESSSLCAIESDTDSDCLMNNELSLALDALSWITSEDCYSDTLKAAAQNAKNAIRVELDLAYRRDFLTYKKSRWSKCPKQSGYAVWYTKNVQGE